MILYILYFVVTEGPIVTSCQTIVDGSGQSVSVLCSNESNLVFVNFVPTQINVTWEAMYLDPNPIPRRPAYVTGFDVGLASLYAEASLYRASSKYYYVHSYTHMYIGFMVIFAWSNIISIL